MWIYGHLYWLELHEFREGIKEGAISTAKKMLADGTVALEKIAEFVGLSIDEVEKIKAGQTI